jgi:hypothetical protein
MWSGTKSKKKSTAPRLTDESNNDDVEKLAEQRRRRIQASTPAPASGTRSKIVDSTSSTFVATSLQISEIVGIAATTTAHFTRFYLHRRRRRSARGLLVLTSADPPSFAASRQPRKITTKTLSRLTRPPPPTLVPVRRNLPNPAIPKSAAVRPRLPRRLRVCNGTSIKSDIHLIS